MDSLFLGIDVGTGSARAGLFDAEGRMQGVGTREIAMNRPRTDFVEQSSDDIWRACGEAVRQAMSQAGAAPDHVRGIGFDATCSLVVVDADDCPVTVSPTGDDQWNIIVWMDHRATDQASRINATGHAVLRYVGGVISPEMETPKLLWLRENMPETWRRAAHLFDLPDWLVHRATGSLTRSLCTTVCKWTYLGHEEPTAEGSVGRWDASYFEEIGLGDLAAEEFRRIGTRVRPMGESVGGLSEQAARELGLSPETPVGVSIIDAHAGGLGLVGAPLDGRDPIEADFNRRLALIGGTSSCHMACSQDARFIGGIWGPYFSAMIPGLWLTEGGQSATGALIDHVILSHARASDLEAEARAQGRTIYDLLNERLAKLAEGAPFPASLTRGLHVLPYFHGNRSPRADPTLRGMISGLRLDDSVDALALLYLATIQAVAHGTRHIIDEMNAQGYAIDTVLACGGGTKNPVFLREHADATGCRIALPREPEAVLLGSAILGAVAAERFGSVVEAMGAMNAAGEIIKPSGGDVAAFHGAKHRVFQRMFEDQMAYRELMGG
ncbi:FGGY-family carbohydrate kinase [Candidatus Sumerlaeota bacterium]|nr:FGGY-family carbohydrate kinase [Candidatus Sumerlaeota bacterium]